MKAFGLKLANALAVVWRFLPSAARISFRVSRHDRCERLSHSRALVLLENAHAPRPLAPAIIPILITRSSRHRRNSDKRRSALDLLLMS